MLIFTFEGYAQEIKIITSVESIVPSGLGRSRIVDAQEEKNFGEFTSTQTEEGYYAKLGDWVYVHGQTTITSVGSGGGILRITLPFSAVCGYRGALSVGINQALSLPSTAGNGYMNIIVELGSTAAYLVGTAIGGGHHHMGIGDASAGLFSFSGVYRAA